MEFQDCPRYQDNTKIEEKYVTKEACGFRWEIISNKGDELLKSVDRINGLEKNVEIIQSEKITFDDVIKSMEIRQKQIEDKIEKLITRNEVNDQTLKIHLDRKKRKQHIRDTIITGVVIAFIIGTLAGGWALFKKVTIILENSTNIKQSLPYSQPKHQHKLNYDPYMYHPKSDIPLKSKSNIVKRR